MKGDFTRNTFDPSKNYTRVAKQQGRVDLDADFNEQADILHNRDTVEATDTIGAYGVPVHSGGFKIVENAGQLAFTPGRLYLNGLLVQNTSQEPVPLANQIGVDFDPHPGSYLIYLDVWERYISALEDPQIRETALGGPDTAGRIQTHYQVKAHPLQSTPSAGDLSCQPYPAPDANGAIQARAEPAALPENPCVVGESGGYRGLENRLYRVELFDDGRDETGAVVRPVTFTWSRDNGSIVLPVAPDGIDNQTITLRTLGPDHVLTVQPGDWVELCSNTTRANGKRGMLARIDAIDPGSGDFPQVTLDRSAASLSSEKGVTLRRWDQKVTPATPLLDGAVEISSDWIELEHGVQVRFDPSLSYQSGDYWTIPARTRTASIQWPDASQWVARQGIQHHYATLGMVTIDETGIHIRDCRPLFDPLTELDSSACCIHVHPGESIQSAIDTVIGRGGGCIKLCPGYHLLSAPLRIANTSAICISGCGPSTRLFFPGQQQEPGAIVLDNASEITLEHFSLFSTATRAVLAIVDKGESHSIRLHRMQIVGFIAPGTPSETHGAYPGAAIRLSATKNVEITECSLAAEVAIAAASGPQLPVLGTVQQMFEQQFAMAQFEDFSAFLRELPFTVGEQAHSQQLSLEFTDYPDPSGNGRITQGSAQTTQTGNSIGLVASQIMVQFTPHPSAHTMSFAVAVAETSEIVVNVGGSEHSLDSLQSLNGAEIAGARFSVVQAGSSGQFALINVHSEQPLQQLGLGGQRLAIAAWAAGAEDGQLNLDPTAWGSAVEQLTIRNSTLRFSTAGIAALALDKAIICHTTIHSISPHAFRLFAGENLSGMDSSNELPSSAFSADANESAINSHGIAKHLVKRAQQIFASEQTYQTGAGLVGWFIRSASLHHASIRARLAVAVVLFVNSECTAGQIRGHSSAIWIAQAYNLRISCAHISSQNGRAVALATAWNTRIENCAITADRGVCSTSLWQLQSVLTDISVGLTRALYGLHSEGAVRGFLWLGLYQSTRFWKLHSWFTQIDSLVTSFLPSAQFSSLAMTASALEQQLRKPMSPENSLYNTSLLFGELHINHNDVRTTRTAISFKNIFALGTIHIGANTTHSAEAKGIELLSTTYAAHTEVIQQLILAGLAALSKRFSQWDSLQQLQGLVKQIGTSMAQWLKAARKSFTTDISIEDNAVFAHATGIETNLFETRIARNHLTIAQRSGLGQDAAFDGHLFGTVTDQQNRGVANVTVYLPDTHHATRTDARGFYQLTGLAPSSYTPQVQVAGYNLVNPQTIQLAEGESRRINLSLRQLEANEFSYGMTPYYDTEPEAYHTEAAAAATNAQTRGIIDILEQHELFFECAELLREAGWADTELLAESLTKSIAQSNNETVQQIDAMLADIQGATNDAQLQAHSQQMRSELLNTDHASFAQAVTQWVAALMRLIDSRGILVRAPGCSIVDNRVVVAKDEDRATEAVGGIHLSIDYRQQVILVLLQVMLDQFIKTQSFSLSAPSENRLGSAMQTLLAAIAPTHISRNEISKGIGHGICLFGNRRQPEFLRGATLQANTIIGCGGSGIFVNDAAMVLDFSIQDNRIETCGDERSFSTAKAGVYIDTASQITCQDNTIIACGMGQQIPVYGIYLQSIINLQVIGNALIGNGGTAASYADGGLRIVHAGGAVGVSGNSFEANRGMAVLWDGNGEGAVFVNKELEKQARSNRSFLGTSEQTRATFSNNLVTQADESISPPVLIADLQSLAATGNNITSDGLCIELHRMELVSFSTNVLQSTTDISGLIVSSAGGVVSSNSSTGPIHLQNCPGVVRSLNFPPAI